MKITTMFTRCATLIVLLAAASIPVLAQDGPSAGQRLQGKVGGKLMSTFDHQVAPREVDLARLQLPEEAEEQFRGALRGELDGAALEELRQQKIERMQRKLGTSMVAAAALRGLELEDETEASARPRPETEEVDKDGRAMWLTLGGCFALIGWLIWKTRAS